MNLGEPRPGRCWAGACQGGGQVAHPKSQLLAQAVVVVAEHMAEFMDQGGIEVHLPRSYGVEGCRPPMTCPVPIQGDAVPIGRPDQAAIQ